MEDRFLVFRSQQGCKDSFHRIYEKYRDDLLILAVALLNDTALGEDVVHDVFLAFAQSLSSFKLTGSLKSYLMTCAANSARNKLKAKYRSDVDLEHAAEIATTDDQPAARVVINEELTRLSRALAKLPAEQREVIVLNTHGGLSLRSIAKQQGQKVNTVKSRYRYGIVKLRSLLY